MGGAGLHRIKEFRRGKYILLEANPCYYELKPRMKIIVVKLYEDGTTLRFALEHSKVDIA